MAESQANKKSRRTNLTLNDFEKAWRELGVKFQRDPSIREIGSHLGGGSHTSLLRWKKAMVAQESASTSGHDSRDWAKISVVPRNKSLADQISKSSPWMKFQAVTTAYQKLVAWYFSRRSPNQVEDAKLARLIKTDPSQIGKLQSGERVLDVVEYVLWCNAAGLDPVNLLKELVSDAGGLR